MPAMVYAVINFRGQSKVLNEVHFNLSTRLNLRMSINFLGLSEKPFTVIIIY